MKTLKLSLTLQQVYLQYLDNCLDTAVKQTNLPSEYKDILKQIRQKLSAFLFRQEKYFFYGSPLLQQIEKAIPVLAGEIKQTIVKNFRLQVAAQNQEVLKVILFDSGLNWQIQPDLLGNWLTYLSRIMWQRMAVNCEYSPNKSPANFAIQYTHARCCGLLRLAHYHKLIVLHDPYFNSLTWNILQPQHIVYLQEKQDLILIKPIEYKIIEQLILISDNWHNEQKTNWLAIGKKFSQQLMQFTRQCPIVPADNCYLDLSLARIGLIALAQLWLKLILEVKLHTQALSHI